MKAVYIDDELHQQARLSAARRRVSLKRIIEDCVRSQLRLGSPEGADVATADVTAAAAGGGAFDFWDSQAEDLYGPLDGEPIE